MTRAEESEVGTRLVEGVTQGAAVPTPACAQSCSSAAGQSGLEGARKCFASCLLLHAHIGGGGQRGRSREEEKKQKP